MYDDVKYFFIKIFKCIKEKTPKTTQDYYIFLTHGTDWVRLPAPGHMYIWFSNLLVIKDHFTRCIQVYLMGNKEAKTAATKLLNDYILRFGTSVKILYD